MDYSLFFFFVEWQHVKIVHRCEMLCDTVIELKSLKDVRNPIYQEQDGLLLVKKLPVINTWSFTVPDGNDWGFKFANNRFIVQVFILVMLLFSSI